MGLVLVTAPSSEPVTLATAKLHVRQDLADDDAILPTYIAAARRAVEEYTGRQLLAARWRLSLDHGPGVRHDCPRCGYAGPLAQAPGVVAWAGGCDACERRPLVIPRPPLVALASVQYTALDGTPTTLTSAGYRLDADGDYPRLWPPYQEPWPACRVGPAAFAVTFDAGYPSAAAVPPPVVEAILLLLGDYYERRELTLAAPAAAELPRAVTLLLDPFRVDRYQ